MKSCPQKSGSGSARITITAPAQGEIITTAHIQAVYTREYAGNESDSRVIFDGQTKHSGYNELGMATEVFSAEETIVYQYSGQGYLVSVTNANGDIVSDTYDMYGNKASMIYLDGRTVSCTYDAMNRMPSITGLDV